MKNNFIDKVLSVCLMERAAWCLLFSFILVNAAQPDSLKINTIPSGLHLNAKGVLIQTNSSDEYVVDSSSNAVPSANPPKTLATDTSNKSRDLTGSFIENKKTAQLQKIPSAEITSAELVKTKEMFRTLGGFHKLMGIYGAVTGALGILAGVVLLDKPDDAAFAMSFITLGGISIGFGLWEINVGGKLLKYGTNEK
jgi:hypothetical protein